jgi:hypothetical protein
LKGQSNGPLRKNKGRSRPEIHFPSNKQAQERRHSAILFWDMTTNENLWALNLCTVGAGRETTIRTHRDHGGATQPEGRKDAKRLPKVVRNDRHYKGTTMALVTTTKAEQLPQIRRQNHQKGHRDRWHLMITTGLEKPEKRYQSVKRA